MMAAAHQTSPQQTVHERHRTSIGCVSADHRQQPSTVASVRARDAHDVGEIRDWAPARRLIRLSCSGRRNNSLRRYVCATNGRLNERTADAASGDKARTVLHGRTKANKRTPPELCRGHQILALHADGTRRAVSMVERQSAKLTVRRADEQCVERRGEQQRACYSPNASVGLSTARG